MLITNTREISRRDRIVSIFWSHNLLCQISRGATVEASWAAHIRLWEANQWLEREDRLERLARCWAAQAVSIRPYCEVEDVTAVVPWIIIRSPNPRAAIRHSLVRQPDQYWYQGSVPKRDKKHYRLAKTFMKYIRPVALHVCRCIVTARLAPVFDDRELVIWPNPSSP